MAQCNCDTGLFNLQSATCLINPGITRKFIFVEYFKSDGTINGVDLSQPFGETEIDALINQSDAMLRWFLSDSISNFATERDDPITETIDNINYNITQGPRNMSGDFLASSTELAGKINSNNCVEMGVYLVDQDNGVSGIVNRDLWLDPIRLERNAFGKVVFPTETAIFKVSYSSTWQRSVNDGDVRVLPFSEHQTDILNKRGLVDVNASSEATTSTTTATVRWTTTDGSASGSPFTGLVFGDFTMNNTTTNLPVVVSASVENPDGTYEVTFAAQTSLDNLTITAASPGFDFEVAKVVAQ